MSGPEEPTVPALVLVFGAGRLTGRPAADGLITHSKGSVVAVLTAAIHGGSRSAGGIAGKMISHALVGG